MKPLVNWIVDLFQEFVYKPSDEIVDLVPEIAEKVAEGAVKGALMGASDEL